MASRTGPILHGQDPVPAEEQAHLLVTGLLVRPHHPQHDQDVIVEALDFGPLRDVHRVLERQRVQPEALAQPGQHLGLAEPLHVDPGDAARPHLGERVLDPLHRALDVGVGSEGDHGDVRRLAGDALGRLERAGRLARSDPHHAPRPPPERGVGPVVAASSRFHHRRSCSETVRWLSSARVLE